MGMRRNKGRSGKAGSISALTVLAVIEGVVVLGFIFLLM